MKVIAFTDMAADDQAQLRRAVEQTRFSLNKNSNPQVASILQTESGATYVGNNIFLSNCTLVCSEASALSAAVAAGDLAMRRVYMAVRRKDGSESSLISPCGNCRQMLHDFAVLANHSIVVMSTTNLMQDVLMTDSDELLPEGFKSVSLGKLSSSS